MSPENVLLVSSSEKGREMLSSLMQSATGKTKLCINGIDARQDGMTDQYDAIIINTPLTDESGLDLAADLAQHTSSSVLLLVKAELADAVSERMMPSGVLVIPKPVPRMLFDQALAFAMASRHRMMAVMQENEKLQRKLAEVKVVDRAKCVLIQYLSMTEDQAHRHIEKQAMDTRQTRVSVAKDILSMYAL